MARRDKAGRGMASAAEIGMFMAIIFFVIASARSSQTVKSAKAESSVQIKALELALAEANQSAAPAARVIDARAPVLVVKPAGQCASAGADFPCARLGTRLRSPTGRVHLQVARDVSYAELHPVLLSLSEAKLTPLLPEQLPTK